MLSRPAPRELETRQLQGYSTTYDDPDVYRVGCRGAGYRAHRARGVGSVLYSAKSFNLPRRLISILYESNRHRNTAGRTLSAQRSRQRHQRGARYRSNRGARQPLRRPDARSIWGAPRRHLQVPRCHVRSRALPLLSRGCTPATFGRRPERSFTKEPFAAPTRATD